MPTLKTLPYESSVEILCILRVCKRTNLLPFFLQTLKQQLRLRSLASVICSVYHDECCVFHRYNVIRQYFQTPVHLEWSHQASLLQ